MPVFKLGKRLGVGAEGETFEIIPNEEDNRRREVAKVLRPLKILGVPFNWQPRMERYPEYGAAIKDVGLAIIQSEIVKRFEGQMPDGSSVHAEEAAIVPYVEGMSEMRLSYKHLRDPEKGPGYLRELYDMIEGADKMYNEQGFGLDPYGGEIVLDLRNSLQELLMRQIEKMIPGFLRALIKREVFRFEGYVHNISILDDESRELMDSLNGKHHLLGVMDLGLHNFNEDGDYQIITKLLHHLMIASLSEVVARVNSTHDADKRLSDEEIELLPSFYNGPEIYRKLAIYLLDLLQPLLEENVKF